MKLEAEAAPVGPIQVRSIISFPSDGATLSAGVIEVRGSAWSGLVQVTGVEVSVDGGDTWIPAEIASDEGANVCCAVAPQDRHTPGKGSHHRPSHRLHGKRYSRSHHAGIRTATPTMSSIAWRFESSEFVARANTCDIRMNWHEQRPDSSCPAGLSRIVSVLGPMFIPIGGAQLPRRLLQLTAGLIVFGMGIGLMLRCGLGVPPWDVLHQGLAIRFGLTVGIWSIIISIAVLLLWLPLREPYGAGTLLNAILIGVVIDLTAAALPDAESAWLAWDNARPRDHGDRFGFGDVHRSQPGSGAP